MPKVPIAEKANINMVLSTDIVLIVFIVFTNSISSQMPANPSNIRNRFSEFKNTEKNNTGKIKTNIKLTAKPAFKTKIKLLMSFFIIQTSNAVKTNKRAHWIRKLSDVFKI